MSTITASVRVFNADPVMQSAIEAALVAIAETTKLDGSIRVETTDTDPETGGKRQVTTSRKVFNAAVSEDEQD